MTFLDGTNIRTHHKAAGAQKRGPLFEKRDHREALGCSRSDYGTKTCVIADEHGKAFDFALAPVQAHELPLAPAMHDNLPAIPVKRRDGPVACPKWAHQCRHLVENLWTHLQGVARCRNQIRKNN
ncbi:hypothetical protein KUA02_16065 [Komagataeibacter pomaceti]|nr:hypothetical protein [Novacetimonas pomaceti]